MEIRTTLKQYDGNDWCPVYIKTSADMVELSNGKTVEEAIAPLGGATTSQEVIDALGAGVRDNLFFNGNFSIWQCYPDGVYTGVPYNIYIPDGFIMLSGDGSIPNTFERVPEGGIKLVSGPPNRIKRRISNAERFNGKRMTLSCWKSQGYYEKTITATDWNDETDVIGCFSADELLWIRPGQTFFYMKLEEGEGQTLFYQDANGDYHLLPQPNSDYLSQLEKCQFYFKPISGFYIGGTSGGTNTDVSFFVPGVMRTIPSVTNVSKYDMYIQGQEIPEFVVYIGDAQFECISRGAGYVVKAHQSVSIGPNKAGKIGVDAGYFDARL